MRTRLFTLAGCLFLAAASASAQSRDPFFATFSANYDIIYHQQDNTSNAGAHFDVASTIKRDVPILGLMGEAGFIQGGAGLDFKMRSNNLRIRTQIDVRHVFDDVDSFNAVRLSAGVVVPLNR